LTTQLDLQEQKPTLGVHQSKCMQTIIEFKNLKIGERFIYEGKSFVKCTPSLALDEKRREGRIFMDFIKVEPWDGPIAA